MPSEELPPKTPTDALDREVALKANIDRSGLTVAGKSRALSAIDRLLGGIFGWPAEFFEGKRANAQARREAREALIRADAAAAVKHLEGMSQHGQATVERFLRDEFRKQDNRIAVASYSEEQLLASPEPRSSQSSFGPSAPNEDPIELDEDWINIFSRYAEEASSDRLRELWGRILAGEIRQPGSFAPTTLRVIAEMDSEIARGFQEVYRVSINGYGLRPEPFEGKTLEHFAFLEQAGLVQTDVNLQMSINAVSDGFGYIFGEKLLLRITYMPGSKMVAFPAVRITRVGMQIGTILPRDEEVALRQIAGKLTEAKKVELCFVTGRQPPAVHFNIIEVLHEV